MVCGFNHQLVVSIMMRNSSQTFACRPVSRVCLDAMHVGVVCMVCDPVQLGTWGCEDVTSLLVARVPSAGKHIA